ncbi:DNA adenine methylase [Methanolobus bombayensis]|uniref:DNA adenine methylase n=1 Tax=Methanolobus bombayensis TaxID=38023 RepID=UPI001FD75866|nr:DNA adenine methylase [Methanolobus bombayensis]
MSTNQTKLGIKMDSSEKETINHTLDSLLLKNSIVQKPVSNTSKSNDMARPFLKWAGGKKQLLEEFDKRYPMDISTARINKYVEPFVGGGAVLFHVLQEFELDECHIYDANEELILVYSVVQKDVDGLIEKLRFLQSSYLDLDEEGRKEFFYSIRMKFNESKSKIDFETYGVDWVKRASELIFLNRTCFNGLFRVNSKGEFNVPMGRYKNPKIVDETNLQNASMVLKNVIIHHGDFEDCESVVDERTFVYFDPPYRPISKTSSFNSYSKDAFDDESQMRLARFYKKLHLKGAKLMLSNSDPKNENPDDHFFEDIYPEFKIERVPAKRMINAKGSGRGSINELIITNYSE